MESNEDIEAGTETSGSSCTKRNRTSGVIPFSQRMRDCNHYQHYRLSKKRVSQQIPRTQPSLNIRGSKVGEKETPRPGEVDNEEESGDPSHIEADRPA